MQIEIPTALEHLKFIRKAAIFAESEASSFSLQAKEDLVLLGDSMHAIYLSATCAERCLGGPHNIEYIGARVYNLSAAAYNLIVAGFYDEAQSLIRSIGEISNILSLSVCDHASFEEWLVSDKQKRISSFSPAKVRKMVERSNGVLIMSQQTYSDLCEDYTHLIPGVRPNNYDHNRNVCGGVSQKSGFKQSISLLSYIVSMLGLFFCKHSGLDNEFSKIEHIWRGRSGS
jgi:hypothetical protein